MKKRILTLALALILMLALALPVMADNTKLIAVTFDDGPNPNYTPKLLDELAKRNIKVTFFLNGKAAEAYPDLIRRQIEAGHQIANHTYSHEYLPGLTNDRVVYEVTRTGDYLAGITGNSELLVRPPYGGMSNRVQNLIGAPIIQWSIDPTYGKYEPGPTGSQMANTVVRTAHDGAILLLHDNSQKNLTCLIEAFDRLLAMGYEFVTLDELFRLKGVTPQDNVQYYKVVNDNPEYYDESRIADHWAYDAICYVEENGIMTGDGYSFFPNRYLTRAQAVTVLWRMAGSPDSFAQSQFTDVAVTDWCFGAVAWGARTGVVSGVSPTEFSPDSLVTREQFYTMLSRYIALSDTELSASATPVSFRDDVRTAAYAVPAVDTIRRAGFVSENDREIFRPGDTMTRAEAAELLSWTHQNVAPPADELQQVLAAWEGTPVSAVLARKNLGAGIVGASILGGQMCTNG